MIRQVTDPIQAKSGLPCSRLRGPVDPGNLRAANPIAATQDSG